MKKKLSSLVPLVLFAAVCGYAHAEGDVWVCTNADGTREYKNTGETKGCKRVDLQGISMIPSPYKKATASGSASKPATTAATTASAGPADFPKVDGTTQKARDNDRMQILSEELRTEEKKLASLKTDYNNGEPERRGDERNYAKYQERVAAMKDDISRTEKNIEALKREIGNLK